MKIKRIYGITAAVFVIAAVPALFLMRPSDGTLVEIVQDGTVLRVIDLSDAPDEDIRIPSKDGGSYNIVSVKGGTISVSEAGCPDHTCVHMGTLKSETMPIVCLPNKLIVRFAS